MWLKWIPWRFIVGKVARQQGFIDPITVLSQIQNFAQPADVLFPRELLREGVVLQARGLMNSQAIQHNLDWVWPYWINRQFNPQDCAFIPRSFSLTQINLTNRNWTAVGFPDVKEYPIVDPRGLLTPFYDGWSIDCWIITKSHRLIPAQLREVNQKLEMKENLTISTVSSDSGLSLLTRVEMVGDKDWPICQMKVSALSKIFHEKAWLVVSLRPYNPEGVSFIHHIDLLKDGPGWSVDKKNNVYFDKTPDRYMFSYYRHGDVYTHLLSDEPEEQNVYCKVGLSTAAALFELKPDVNQDVTIQIPFKKDPVSQMFLFSEEKSNEWQRALDSPCTLKVPDNKFQFLYDAALRTLVLHAPDEVYPGPYTYRRFWFRDAAFILNALLSLGLTQRVERALSHFPHRQNTNGYFLSQEGEWDSNGEALWIMQRYCQLTQNVPCRLWMDSVDKGARWISRKRLSTKSCLPHAGLLPPGFSAEHLGPNDYYYWDDFWGIAGLRAAASLEKLFRNKKRAECLEHEAENFLESVEHSLIQAAERLATKAMPAAPYRRLDSGAIGSLVAGYPLQIFKSNDIRLIKAIEYLLENCMYENGFFHDMTHSGINPYLTLHIAQVLLRAGDLRYLTLMKAVAKLASPTGQWPEAIHPITKGGCMGDGQHTWAAAEWVMMIRNCFVREEEAEGKIILCSGVPKEWLTKNEPIIFGPTLTPFGKIQLFIQANANEIIVSWKGEWFTSSPIIEIALPGFPQVLAHESQSAVTIKREETQCASL